MPGSNARALEKAKSLPCDVVIMDLEDAVTPDAKMGARETIAAALQSGGYGNREIVIRVNAEDTEWGAEDLAFASRVGADAVLLPKVETAQTVERAARHSRSPGASDALAVWCMIETPLGVLDVREIAASHPRMGCPVMGTSDLAKDLHCLHTPDRLPMVTSLGLCVLAARAYGLAILDGVHLDLDDDVGLQAACRQGVEFGFDGKTLIHPKTLAAANEAFSPDSDALHWVRRITDAHAAAEASGQGVVLVDGKLVEALHVAEAKRLIALSDRIVAMADT